MMKNILAPLIFVLLALTGCDTYKEESRMVGIGDIDLLTYDFPVTIPTAASSANYEVVPGSSPKEFRVVPMKKGIAVLTVYDTAGKLRNKINYQFVPGPLFEQLREVRHLLENVKGIKIEIVGENIVFNGKLQDPNDGNRVLQVQAAYVDHILNLAVDSQNLCDTRICWHDPEPPLQPVEMGSVRMLEAEAPAGLGKPASIEPAQKTEKKNLPRKKSAKKPVLLP